MNLIEEFVGKYDERSETIERAAGDLAHPPAGVSSLGSRGQVAKLHGVRVTRERVRDLGKNQVASG